MCGIVSESIMQVVTKSDLACVTYIKRQLVRLDEEAKDARTHDKVTTTDEQGHPCLLGLLICLVSVVCRSGVMPLMNVHMRDTCVEHMCHLSRTQMHSLQGYFSEVCLPQPSIAASVCDTVRGPVRWQLFLDRYMAMVTEYTKAYRYQLNGMNQYYTDYSVSPRSLPPSPSPTQELCDVLVAHLRSDEPRSDHKRPACKWRGTCAGFVRPGTHEGPGSKW